MRILLTNDDGIHAPGIEALFMALADPEGKLGGPVGEVVWPVAPLTVQSATSHGVTFHEPLMVTDETISLHMSGVAVDGRPADCVKLAICSLWPERFGAGSRPDLVVSGMNAGANVGINVIYSGTVAAALEAAFLGVPSIAVSLHIGAHHTRFDLAALRARRVIERILASNDPSMLEPHTCLSINVPRTEDGGPEDPHAMPEVHACPMNTHGLIDDYERRLSPRGAPYYWAAGSGFNFAGADAGTDVDHLMKRRITITPLRYDLTAHEAVENWRRVFKSR